MGLTSADVAMSVAVVVLLAMIAALALAETALTRVSRARAAALVEDGRPGAQRLAQLVADPERVLGPVLLVVVTCQLLEATLVGVIAVRQFGAAGVIGSTLLNVIVVFVFAEAAPKIWALQHPDRAALLAARPVARLVAVGPVRWASQVLSGMANLLIAGRGLRDPAFTSEEELLALAEAAVKDHVIEADERDLIEQILEFGDTVVREVMVPRTDMVVVPGDFRVADAMEVAILNGYSRIPASGDGIDDIVGVVHAKDLMRAERDGHADLAVAELARSASFVPETKHIAELMREMQDRQYHLAIVVDEYGGVAGLVTLEDLIEELVGEIVDEFDREEAGVEPVGGQAVRVSARTPVAEVNDLIDVDLPEGDWDTLAGLVMHLVGRVPSEGESVDCGDLVLRAERVQGRRIGKVRINRSGGLPLLRAVGAPHRDGTDPPAGDLPGG